MSKKSDTDESYYTVGTLVKVLDSETFFTTLFDRKYIEFQVEAVQRFKIQKVVSSIAPQLILTCEVLIYDEENSGNNIPLIKIDYDMSLRDSDKVKLLKHLAIEFCELPKAGLSLTMSSKKKAGEIR